MGVKVTEASLKAINAEKKYKEQLNEAAAIAFVVMAESGSIDAVTASEQSLLFAEWAPNISYAVGALRRYGDTLYRCVQAHTSQTGWEPPAAASLWALTSDPNEEWPAWSQPLGAHDAYEQGAQVSHNDKHWISTIDSNIWEPGVYGWDAVNE